MVWTPRPFALKQFARRSDAFDISPAATRARHLATVIAKATTVTGPVTEGLVRGSPCALFGNGSASRLVGSILAPLECMVQSEIISFTDHLLQHCAVRSTPEASASSDAIEMNRLPVEVSICAGQSPPPRAVSARLKVTCPASGDQVLVQRCSFCRFGQGMLLDPTDESLLMLCGFQAK